jgi:hypothetical protein
MLFASQKISRKPHVWLLALELKRLQQKQYNIPLFEKRLGTNACLFFCLCSKVLENVTSKTWCFLAICSVGLSSRFHLEYPSNPVDTIKIGQYGFHVFFFCLCQYICYEELYSKCSTSARCLFSLSLKSLQESTIGVLHWSYEQETFLWGLFSKSINVTECLFFCLCSKRDEKRLCLKSTLTAIISGLFASNTASPAVCSASCSLSPGYCEQGNTFCIFLSKGTAKVQWHPVYSLLKPDIISTIPESPARPRISVLSVSPQNTPPPRHARQVSLASTQRIKQNEIPLLHLCPKAIFSHLMPVPSRSSSHLKLRQLL